MVERLGRHGKGGGVGSAESESSGGGAESGWKTRGRLKTPLTDGAGVAARQGGMSGERRGYAGPACWAAAAGTACGEGKRPSGEHDARWANEGREQVGHGGEVGCSGQKPRKGEEENEILFLFSNPFSNHFKSI